MLFEIYKLSKMSLIGTLLRYVTSRFNGFEDFHPPPPFVQEWPLSVLTLKASIPSFYWRNKFVAQIQEMLKSKTILRRRVFLILFGCILQHTICWAEGLQHIDIWDDDV